MDHRRSLHRVSFYHFCQCCADETRHRRVNGSLHLCLRCSLQTYTNPHPHAGDPNWRSYNSRLDYLEAQAYMHPGDEFPSWLPVEEVKH